MPGRLLIASLLLPLLSLFAGALPPASAAGPDLVALIASLERAGYVVVAGPSLVGHASLAVQGQKLTVDKYGQTAELELLRYPSQAALEADWLALNGQAPVLRRQAPELAGKSPYWRETSVLLIDYRTASDAGTAWIAALAFIGLENFSPHGLRIGIVPPATGNAGLVTH
jgi:hypothetical protein